MRAESLKSRRPDWALLKYRSPKRRKQGLVAEGPVKAPGVPKPRRLGYFRPMIRLFAALPMPAEAVAGLTRRQGGIEAARWSPPENLHLTLRFFGDIREDVARDLDAELVGLRARPFEMVLCGVGTFGEGADSHVLWAGVEAGE